MISLKYDELVNDYFRGHDLSVLDDCLSREVALLTLIKLFNFGMDKVKHGISVFNYEEKNGERTDIVLDNEDFDFILSDVVAMINLATENKNLTHIIRTRLMQIRNAGNNSKTNRQYYIQIKTDRVFRQKMYNLLFLNLTVPAIRVDNTISGGKSRTLLEIIEHIFGSMDNFMDFRYNSSISDIDIEDYFVNVSGGRLVTEGSNVTLNERQVISSSSTSLFSLEESTKELEKVRLEARNRKEECEDKDARIKELLAEVSTLQQEKYDTLQTLNALNNSSIKKEDLDRLKQENDNLKRQIKDLQNKLIDTVSDSREAKNRLETIDSYLMEESLLLSNTKSLIGIQSICEAKGWPRSLEAIPELYKEIPSEVSATISVYLKHLQQLKKGGIK